jgi:molybdopterin synthase sulfur carrier subunit
MHVDVLLFASLREEVGPVCRVEVAAEEETTVGALREALAGFHPAFLKMGRRALVAVNEEWARDTDPIREGDTVAMVPPVAGG